ncbi:hypothetical protein C9374_006784 [Naegleria lovaniensis]|uniref:Transmembrane protein n=1 Tax=Naegleria lovaniensis TaxID=51637 RepID=A0AA88H2A3_NAELO|nr:uncharacterized protein C9374_006784 [Naegleria lovaniensis]KAG2393253.1 hypothetical protein C9374_006784 [Naegleria lovaniensis]
MSSAIKEQNFNNNNSRNRSSSSSSLLLNSAAKQSPQQAIGTATTTHGSLLFSSTSTAPSFTIMMNSEEEHNSSSSSRDDEKPTSGTLPTTSTTALGSNKFRVATLATTSGHQAIASPRGSLKVFSSWVNHQMRSTQWINDLARNFNMLVSANPSYNHEHEDDDDENSLLQENNQQQHNTNMKGFSNSFVHMLRPQNQQIYYSPDNHQNVDSNDLEDHNGLSSAQENEETSFVQSEGEDDEEMESTMIHNKSAKIERKSLLEKHHEYELPSGIILDHDESVMHIEKPAPSFRKNVLILFVFGALVTSLICYLPLNFLSDWIENNEDMTITLSLLLNGLYLAIVAFYLFILFYVLIYKLVYCKLLLTYVVTDKRLFICRGYYPLETLFQKLSSRMSWSILEREDPIMFWSMKDEIEHLYFTLDINDYTASNMSKADKDCVGSIYFGYSVDRVFLPFSVVTEITHAGFVSIPNVYFMLDKIILQCNKLGNYSVQRARLLNASDSELNPRVLEKKYALCGLPLMLCFKQSHCDRKLGKITNEELNVVNYV